MCGGNVIIWAVVCKSCCDFFSCCRHSLLLLYYYYEVNFNFSQDIRFFSSLPMVDELEYCGTTCVCASLFLNFKLNRYLFKLLTFKNTQKNTTTLYSKLLLLISLLLHYCLCELPYTMSVWLLNCSGKIFCFTDLLCSF